MQRHHRTKDVTHREHAKRVEKEYGRGVETSFGYCVALIKEKSSNALNKLDVM